MTLPPVVALHVHELSSLLVLVVGGLALALALVGLSSLRRSGNRMLGFVVAAFFVFALKNFFGAWAIATRVVPHEHLEAVLAVLDLVVVALLALPLLGRLRRRGNSG